MVPGLQAVGSALVSFTIRGYGFSAQFDADGSHAGELVWLRRGWLLGRSVVSIAVPQADHYSRGRKNRHGNMDCLTACLAKPESCWSGVAGVGEHTHAVASCRTCLTSSGGRFERACQLLQPPWRRLPPPVVR